MKVFVFTAAILGSTSAWAQGPTAVASTDNAPDPNQVICRAEPRSESRISRARTCLTRAQWDAQRSESRRATDRSRVSDN